MSILRSRFTPAKTRARNSQKYTGPRTGRTDERSARNILHSGKNWKAYEELLRKTAPPAAPAKPDDATPGPDLKSKPVELQPTAASSGPKAPRVAARPSEKKPKTKPMAAAKTTVKPKTNKKLDKLAPIWFKPDPGIQP